MNTNNTLRVGTACISLCCFIGFLLLPFFDSPSFFAFCLYFFSIFFYFSPFLHRSVFPGLLGGKILRIIRNKVAQNWFPSLKLVIPDYGLLYRVMDREKLWHPFVKYLALCKFNFNSVGPFSTIILETICSKLAAVACTSASAGGAGGPPSSRNRVFLSQYPSTPLPALFYTLLPAYARRHRPSSAL